MSSVRRRVLEVSIGWEKGIIAEYERMDHSHWKW